MCRRSELLSHSHFNVFFNVSWRYGSFLVGKKIKCWNTLCFCGNNWMISAECLLCHRVNQSINRSNDRSYTITHRIRPNQSINRTSQASIQLCLSLYRSNRPKGICAWNREKEHEEIQFTLLVSKSSQYHDIQWIIYNSFAGALILTGQNQIRYRFSLVFSRNLVQ